MGCGAPSKLPPPEETEEERAHKLEEERQRKQRVRDERAAQRKRQLENERRKEEENRRQAEMERQEQQERSERLVEEKRRKEEAVKAKEAKDKANEKTLSRKLWDRLSLISMTTTVLTYWQKAAMRGTWVPLLAEAYCDLLPAQKLFWELKTEGMKLFRSLVDDLWRDGRRSSLSKQLVRLEKQCKQRKEYVRIDRTENGDLRVVKDGLVVRLFGFQEEENNIDSPKSLGGVNTTDGEDFSQSVRDLLEEEDTKTLFKLKMRQADILYRTLCEDLRDSESCYQFGLETREGSSREGGGGKRRGKEAKGEEQQKDKKDGTAKDRIAAVKVFVPAYLQCDYKGYRGLISTILPLPKKEKGKLSSGDRKPLSPLLDAAQCCCCAPALICVVVVAVPLKGLNLGVESLEGVRDISDSDDTGHDSAAFERTAMNEDAEQRPVIPIAGSLYPYCGQGAKNARGQANKGGDGQINKKYYWIPSSKWAPGEAGVATDGQKRGMSKLLSSGLIFGFGNNRLEEAESQRRLARDGLARRKATQHMLYIMIGRVVYTLNQEIQSVDKDWYMNSSIRYNLPQSGLGAIYRYGVPMRHLGCLWQHIRMQDPRLRSRILAEMIARCFKKRLADVLRGAKPFPTDDNSGTAGGLTKESSPRMKKYLMMATTPKRLEPLSATSTNSLEDRKRSQKKPTALRSKLKKTRKKNTNKGALDPPVVSRKIKFADEDVVLNDDDLKISHLSTLLDELQDRADMRGGGDKGGRGGGRQQQQPTKAVSSSRNTSSNRKSRYQPGAKPEKTKQNSSVKKKTKKKKKRQKEKKHKHAASDSVHLESDEKDVKPPAMERAKARLLRFLNRVLGDVIVPTEIPSPLPSPPPIGVRDSSFFWEQYVTRYLENKFGLRRYHVSDVEWKAFEADKEDLFGTSEFHLIDVGKVLCKLLDSKDPEVFVSTDWLQSRYDNYHREVDAERQAEVPGS
eukprot:jgi/Bigna1/79125/fgenesh1_pg.59_\